MHQDRLAAHDGLYANLIRAECRTGSVNIDRTRLDGLILEILRDLGMRQMFVAYKEAMARVVDVRDV